MTLVDIIVIYFRLVTSDDEQVHTRKNRNDIWHYAQTFTGEEHIDFCTYTSFVLCANNDMMRDVII